MSSFISQISDRELRSEEYRETDAFKKKINQLFMAPRQRHFTILFDTSTTRDGFVF